MSDRTTWRDLYDITEMSDEAILQLRHKHLHGHILHRCNTLLCGVSSWPTTADITLDVANERLYHLAYSRLLDNEVLTDFWRSAEHGEYRL